MERFDEILSEYQQRYVPGAQVKLHEVEDLSTSYLLKDFPLLSSMRSIYLRKPTAHILITKITPKLILSIEDGHGKSNMAIFKMLSGKIAQSIRESAITTTV